jgi:hypothetical protein
MRCASTTNDNTNGAAAAATSSLSSSSGATMSVGARRRVAEGGGGATIITSLHETGGRQSTKHLTRVDIVGMEANPPPTKAHIIAQTLPDTTAPIVQRMLPNQRWVQKLDVRSSYPINISIGIVNDDDDDDDGLMVCWNRKNHFKIVFEYLYEVDMVVLDVYHMNDYL